MRESICAAFAVVGSVVASFFGGWSASLTTLVLFMAIDYATGLILAGVFRRSPKSATGGLQSKAGWKGLCRKTVILLLVLAAARVDGVLGTTYIRDAVCIGFICNELISIVENAALMGVPLPEALRDAVDLLQGKTEDEEGEGHDLDDVSEQ